VRCFYVSSTFFLMSSQITLQSDNHLASDHALPCFLMTKESSQRLQWDVQSERGGALRDHACTSPNESCARQSTQDLQYLVISSPSRSTMAFLTLILVKLFSPGWNADEMSAGCTHVSASTGVTHALKTSFKQTWLCGGGGGHAAIESASLSCVRCPERCTCTLRQAS